MTFVRDIVCYLNLVLSSVCTVITFNRLTANGVSLLMLLVVS